MKTTHPTTSPEIQRLENEINAKKAELSKLISETNSTLVKDYSFLAPINIDIQLSELFEDKDELIVVFYMVTNVSTVPCGQMVTMDSTNISLTELPLW
jgi:predicted dithiol-disulfide oxidoreductase (DUF899 family)